MLSELMLRVLFFLAGLFLVLQGAIALAIAKVTFHGWATRRADWLPVDSTGELTLPIWLAPTLVSTGIVTLLYAIALPKRAE